MKIHRILTNQKGLSLFLVVLIFVTIGLIAFGAATLSIRLQKTGKETATIKRMHVIRDALKRYYRGHQDLPAAASVPVGDLNLEQKYRLDAWGQELHYNMVTKDWGGATRTNIVGLSVDDNDVAGVIISSGPNQTRQTTGPPYTTTDDDIVVPVNLSAEAQEIAREELQILAKKVWVYKYCKRNPTPILNDIISDYSLPDRLRHDPWGNEYEQASSGIFYSGGTGSDPITVSEITRNCPGGAAEGGGGPGTPPGGTTEADAYWNFDDGNLGITTLYGDASTDDGALELDGNGDYAQVDNPALYSFERTDSFSIAAWIKTSSDGTIVSKMKDTTYTPGYRVRVNSGDGIVYFEINDDSDGSISAYGTTNVADGNCHHIAVTYDGNSGAGGLCVYVDGSDETTWASGSLGGSIQNDIPFQISGWDGNNDLFTGIIDEVAIYDEAISDTEVQDIYDEDWAFCVTCVYKLPDTGQTATYTTIHGEDSDYEINPPSYTDNGDGTVTDNNTCLMWEVKTNDGSIHDKDNTYAWQNAQDVFIAALNANNFGGYSDWRLPTITELTSIVNYGTYNPAIDKSFFPNTVYTVSSRYWSSTTNASDTARARFVYFSSGGAGAADKSVSWYVRAVRGGQ